MKQNTLFEVEHRPVIKFAGKEYPTIAAAKADALMIYPGMTRETADALILDAEKASDILMWQPTFSEDAPKAPLNPDITDNQIAEACASTGVPYKIAKNRVRHLGWSLGKATTTPVRKRATATPALPMEEGGK